MEHIIKQLKEAAKNTRLSPIEKAAIKSQLLHYAKMHPLNVPNSLTPAVPSPFFSINNFRNKRSISVLVMGGLLMGSSVSFAAEGAVPGNILYPVKVRINENVRGAVTITPKAKAEWEIRLVERRLEEVEKLAVTPGVSSEVRKIAQENLSAYTQKVKDHIAKFEDDDDSENALATAELLVGTLRTHESVIVNISAVVGSVFGENATTTIMGAETVGTSESVGAQDDTDSLHEIISKLHETRGEVEEKHRQLKKKYHREGKNESSSGISDELMSVSASDTATTPPAPMGDISLSSQKNRTSDKEDTIKANVKDGQNHERQEEIRASTGTPMPQPSASISTSIETTSEASTTTTGLHVESTTETFKDSSKKHDND